MTMVTKILFIAELLVLHYLFLLLSFHAKVLYFSPKCLLHHQALAHSAIVNMLLRSVRGLGQLAVLSFKKKIRNLYIVMHSD